MKKLVIAALTAITLASPAHAFGHNSCQKPSIDFKLDSSQNDTFGGFNDTQNERYGFSITYKLPLGNSNCKEREAAYLKRDQESAYQSELNNLERTLRLCKQYGDDHPLLKGKCK